MEDSKFQQQIQQLSAKLYSFKGCYDAFLEKKYVELSKVRELVMVISEFKKINAAVNLFDVVEKSISNCYEMLFVAIHGAESATGNYYLSL
ncbi:hypothetical protein RFI_31369, partial [Reticulomyxa filosa]